jgi:hypothetical protein
MTADPEDDTSEALIGGYFKSISSRPVIDAQNPRSDRLSL